MLQTSLQRYKILPKQPKENTEKTQTCLIFLIWVGCTYNVRWHNPRLYHGGYYGTIGAWPHDDFKQHNVIPPFM